MDIRKIQFVLSIQWFNYESEGFNFLFKRKDLNGHKEVDVDIAILSFNQLHIYYFNEIRRGFGGVGNFNLKREFCRLRTTFNVQELRKVESPEDIVKFIKKNLDDLLNQRKNSQLESSSESGSLLGETNSQSGESVGQPANVSESGSQANSEFGSQANSESGSQANTSGFRFHRQASNEIRAQWFIDNNKVELCPKMQVFNVKNEKDIIHAVKLNPESCSCPEKKGCAHLLAAKLAVGLLTKREKNKFPNLNQLKSNYRGKKKTGRKYRDNIPEENNKKRKLNSDTDITVDIEPSENETINISKATTSKPVAKKPLINIGNKTKNKSTTLVKKIISNTKKRSLNSTKNNSRRTSINISVNTSRASSLTLSKDQIALVNLVIEEKHIDDIIASQSQIKENMFKTKPNDIPDNVFDYNLKILESLCDEDAYENLKIIINSKNVVNFVI